MAIARTDLEIKLATALKRVASYRTLVQLTRDAKNIGIEPSEMIEMAYENAVADAKNAIRGVRIGGKP